MYIRYKYLITLPITSSLVLRFAERCQCAFPGCEPTGFMNYSVVKDVWPGLFSRRVVYIRNL